MVGALFITMLFVAQLRFGASQDTLTVEVIAISCMAVAGLMILIRQTLVASHVQTGTPRGDTQSDQRIANSPETA